MNVQLSNVNSRRITRRRDVTTLLTSLSNSPDELSVDTLFKIAVIKTYIYIYIYIYPEQIVKLVK